MSRYTRTPVTSGFEVQSQLNQNFSDIQAAIDDTLSRVGDQPNQMEANIDMNSNRIYNLPTASSPTEPVTYAQWSAGQTQPVYAGTIKERYVATASQTVFTTVGSYTPGSNNLNVYINGVKQDSTAYAENSSTQFTFTSGLDAGDVVEVILHERVSSSSVVTASNTTVSYNGTTNVQAMASDIDTRLDTIEAWKAAGTLALTTGQNLSQDGAYNSGYYKLGAYYIWQDAAGSLRMKTSAPASATDGVSFGSYVFGSATYDPPSLADGVGTTTTVTATGAAVGDFTKASFSLDTQGITVTSWVSAANTVSVRFQNESGGVLDLGSGTLRVRVEKV